MHRSREGRRLWEGASQGGSLARLTLGRAATEDVVRQAGVSGELRPQDDCLNRDINVTHKITHHWGSEICVRGGVVQDCAETPRQREGLQDPGIYRGDGLHMLSV